ncbi:predicted protein [Aspergillus terreus NIH2624]|uniref:Uncharacterized protein n=1 Tax=Aspergillus terreus (strain NIH 2624 / FGSC A1156) TaxID=341663 RepID=Q0CAR8_ASPTN|nr:uncharacterized protein ATEG_09216 [Aspergillus terreus NIH2624]EAU30353.1 predicted protein [Aspergillus terreus NIH2624]
MRSTLPTPIFNRPSSTIRTISANGVRINSSSDPEYAVSLVSDGISSITSTLATLPSSPPTVPARHTVPPFRAHRSESRSVRAPTSSNTLSNPSTPLRRICVATSPLSIHTSRAPASRSTPARSVCRVVAATNAPCVIAIAIAASPTVVVPPRTSTRSPARSASPRITAPHAVGSSVGSAPSIFCVCAVKRPPHPTSCGGDHASARKCLFQSCAACRVDDADGFAAWDTGWVRGCGVLVCTGTQVAAVEAEGVHADADAIGGGCRERYGFEAEHCVSVDCAEMVVE